MEQTEQNHDDEINIQEAIAILWKQKINIALITFLFTICAIIYAFTLPAEFSSTTLFISKTGGVNANQNHSNLASLAINSLRSQAIVNHTGYLDNVAKDENFLYCQFN